ncbi:MAG: alpha/beta hydrolase [Pseudomonadota bacterium]
MPEVLSRMADGRFNEIVPYIEDMLEVHLDEDWGDGLYYSVQCREDYPFNDMAVALNAGRKYPLIEPFHEKWVKLEADICKIWNVPKAPPEERGFKESKLPALILAGQYDPVIPPAWGKRLHALLPNSHFYEFKGISHDVISSSQCARNMTADFLIQPYVGPTEEACVTSGSD